METLTISENRQTRSFTIALNRPEVRNAFNPKMIEELTNLFKTLNESKFAWVRSVVLRGEGPCFCAGADLAWMKSMVNYSFLENQTDSEDLYAMFDSIKHCIRPILAQVHGAAFGGALGLMAAADVVVADASARFCFSEVKLGLAPAVISSFIVPKVALSQVSPYMISGKQFSAPEAQRMGLVTEVADLSALESRVTSWVESFSQAAPQAVQETKKLLISLAHQTSDGGSRALTTSVIASRRVSAEGQEGLKAFLDGQKPSWI